MQRLRYPFSIGLSPTINTNLSLFESSFLVQSSYLVQDEKNGEKFIQKGIILPIATSLEELCHKEIYYGAKIQLRWEKELEYVIGNTEGSRGKGQYMLLGKVQQSLMKSLVNGVRKGNILLLWIGTSGYGVMMDSILGSFSVWLCSGNALPLKVSLNLRPNVKEGSQEKLVLLIAEEFINSNSNIHNKNACWVENQQQNSYIAIDLLYKPNTGFDVGKKFRRVDDLEFTQQYAICSLLDTPLSHGKNCDIEVRYKVRILGFLFHNWRPLEGHYNLYTQLVAGINLKEPTDYKDVADLVVCLTALTGEVTCIRNDDPQTLLAVTIGISWWNRGVDVMNALAELGISLALSQHQYVNLCFEMLVSEFMPLHTSSSYIIELLETVRELYKKQQVQDCVHSPSKNIANLVPLAPSSLEKDQGGYKLLQRVAHLCDCCKVCCWYCKSQHEYWVRQHCVGLLMDKTGRTWWLRFLQIGFCLFKNVGLLWLAYIGYGVLLESILKVKIEHEQPKNNASWDMNKFPWFEPWGQGSVEERSCQHKRNNKRPRGKRAPFPI